MKLLILTQKVDGADENLGSFCGWLEEFSKHCAEVAVIANAQGKFSAPRNVAVFSLGKEKNAPRIVRLYRFFKLFSYHYARCDAVFFHMIPEFVLLASPFLLSLRKPSALWYVHKSVTWKLRMAEKLVDFIFTASALSFRLPSKKVFFTGHAIDAELFSPQKNIESARGGLRLISAGRISPVKDIESVIAACVLLKKSWDREWVLSIVGGPLMKRDQEYLLSLKKAIAGNGLESRIVLQGPRPYSEIPLIYREHDIFISMSQTGSMDKAVLEAMASGLTVITSNESFREIISPPYFLEKNSPELLAERIKMLSGENRPNLKLRNLVVEKHGLAGTIKKICGKLASNIS